MATFTERGHAKNVATFEDLISFCIGYGTAYNPGNANITIAGLQAKQASALADLLAVKTTKQALDNATNEREILFADFRKFSTQIVSTLKSFSVTQQTIDDANVILRKIRGKRANGGKEKVKPGTEPPVGPDDNSISVSQQSYDSVIDHMGKLVELITAQPVYTPNEPTLTVAGLNTLLGNMQTSNTAVINATTAFSNARIARDKSIYDPVTGVVKYALEVKNYVKGLFGASSPQYKQVSKLQFVSRKV
jgi:hypothetical protein